MAGWRKIVGVSILAIVAAQAAAGAAKRILYVTATYGFRHDSIETSIQVMQDLAAASGVFAVDNTEDVSLINADNLRNYDAVYFFTSGELPLSDRQKADLLDFIRSGKGFGGSHSATDTLYTWPEYGDMIGGIFDGHPWTQEAAEDVEDPENPIVGHMAPGFRTLEEYYQFRNFSRDNVRVLLTLNTGTVDLSASGVNRTDGDFASVWIRRYGQGRVFYSAFGHFNESFTQPMFRTMLMQALLWLTGEIDMDATPRSGPSWPAPSLTAAGVTTPGGTNDAFAPGSIVSIAGDGLTSGSSLTAGPAPLPARLAGTHVEVNGEPAPLFSVTPGMLMAQFPADLPAGADVALTVSSVNRASLPVMLHIDSAAPGILSVDRVADVLEIRATGLGATDPAMTAGAASPGQPPALTLATPTVRIGDRTAEVQFSELAPGLIGVYLVNAAVPPDVAPDADGALPVILESGGRQSAVYRFSAAP
jgi:uncharacterized protein (TIGR03437 family)